MKILIDNGHGVDTLGKCSPDRRLLEWAWTRKAATLLEKQLRALGYDAERIVTEEVDISLSQRIKRVNDIYKRYGSKNVVLVSIHNNAAGADGKWHEASGFSVFVAPNASENSRKLAKYLTIEFGNADLLGNRHVPLEKYWTGNFAMVAKTNCPAVLTENFFQDNKDDVEYLLSAEGIEEIVDLHVKALQRYIKAQQ